MRTLFAALLSLLCASSLAAQPAMTVDTLTCEGRTNPLAIDSTSPRLSWILHSGDRAQRQNAYQVLVATTAALLAADTPDLWDSGKVATADSLNITYAGPPLRSAQRCHWKVRVWDAHDAPSDWSAPAAWEMALLAPTDWIGQWINDGKAVPTSPEDLYKEDPAPLFRTEFTLPSPVRAARLHIAGLGYYEASINAARVGDHALDPGWTAYDKRVLYSTYDVTDSLLEGDNCLAVTVGNGWYSPLPLRMWGHLNLRDHLPTGRPRFIAQLNIELADGTTRSIVSDTSWRVTDGPIRFNNTYLGEIYDARLELPGWDAPGFDDSSWRTPAIATEPIGPLHAQAQPPIRAAEPFPAVGMTEPAPGVFIYDLGRNFAGWASMTLEAPAGTKLVLRYAELLNPDGSLNPLTSVCGQIKSAGVGGPGAPPIAWQTDTYIARGGSAETYAPRFTFHAFRYVEITGLPHALPLDAVTGIPLHADVPSAGSFACSNERFNRIQQMCRDTFLSNIFSVQSDCPHRERFAYGGDIAATSEAFILNFDMSAFYAKAVRDFADSARPDGMLTDTAPFVGIQYCGVGWAIAHPLLLSQLHQYYADSRLTEEQYDTAKRWLLLVAGANQSGLINDGLGDHESLEPAPAPPLVTPLYIRSAEMLAAMARRLGRGNDAAIFDALAQRSRDAYLRAFVDPATGKVGPGTQASQSIALATGLVPDETHDAALGFLTNHIRTAHNSHLSTGIMGTKCLLDVLSRAGRADLAYTIVNQPDFPGWGWMLENGATTLWEHWAPDANTFSHNHPMFGSVSQWFYNWLGGIQPAPDAAGFDRIIIHPQTIPALDWVECRHTTVRGPITSNWRRYESHLQLDIEIPIGATADIYLPAPGGDLITESQAPLADAKDVEVLRTEQGCIVCRVGSGKYSFAVMKNQ